jgi:hypothetical protein
VTTSKIPRARLLIAITAAAALLTAVGGASAAPAAGTQWAYGFTYAWGCNSYQSCTGSASGSIDNGTVTISQLSAHLSVGAAVIFSQSPTGASTSTVEVQKVLAAHASMALSAAEGGESASENATAIGLYRGWSNATVTNASTVLVYNSATGTYSPAAALGLQGGTSSESANGTLTASVSGAGLPSNAGEIYYSAAEAVSITASFSPALGLVPNNLYQGESWESNATYTASSSGYISYHTYVPCAYEEEGGSGTCTDNSQGANLTGSTLVPASGNVWVYGYDLGPYSIGGLTFQVITLNWTGSIAATDGVFINAGTGVDDLGLGAQSGPVLHAEQRAGLGDVATPKVTVNPPDGLDYSTTAGHLGFEGSNELSSLNDLSTYTNQQVPPAGPESVSAAQSSLTGLEQPYSFPPSGSSSGSNLLLIVVVVVVIAVVVMVVAVLAIRGRKKRSAVAAAQPSAATPAAPATAQPTAYQSYPPPPSR